MNEEMTKNIFDIVCNIVGKYEEQCLSQQLPFMRKINKGRLYSPDKMWLTDEEVKDFIFKHTTDIVNKIDAINNDAKEDKIRNVIDSALKDVKIAISVLNNKMWVERREYND